MESSSPSQSSHFCQAITKALGSKNAMNLAKASGSEISILEDPIEAVSGADAVYTDVWASMGQEEEQKHRERAFSDFQVTSELMALANDGALFMHCLPAHRGEEVSADVIDGEHSVVWDEAENRLHVQKAVMMNLLGADKKTCGSIS